MDHGSQQPMGPNSKRYGNLKDPFGIPGSQEVITKTDPIITNLLKVLIIDLEALEFLTKTKFKLYQKYRRMISLIDFYNNIFL